MKSLEADCVADFNNARDQINKLVANLTKRLSDIGIDEIAIYGSFATELWLRNCDIDILLIPKDR